MITHSEACKSAWAIESYAEWNQFNQAWHYTCDETCVNQNGRNKDGDSVSFPDGGGVLVVPKAVVDADRLLDRMVEALRTPIPTSIFTAKETPMPERQEVSVTNVVSRTVQHGRDIVLETEDRTTRTLFFDTAEQANDFVSSLAEPAMPEHDVGDVHNHYQRICGDVTTVGGRESTCLDAPDHPGVHTDRQGRSWA